MADRDWVEIDWNWWLERPDWAPAWLSAADDSRPDHRLRWLRGLITVVLVVGVSACVAKGADGPADPELGLLCSPEAAGVVSVDDAGIATDPGDLLDVFGTVSATVRVPDGEDVDLCLLHATTAEQRARGLMHVEDLGGLDGMLFSYTTDTESRFYMFNTPMPLTIYWWAADGTFAGATDMEPCLVADPADCPVHGPERPYRHALEVPKGALDAVGIDGEATITVHTFG